MSTAAPQSSSVLGVGDIRRIPWKNGRGWTEELALWPPDATFERGDFDWRISSAQVEEPGPFSTFAGCERILVITAGPGLDLAHGAAAPRARLRPHEPYRFSGDWPTEAGLCGGPVADFSVIARRGRVRADVLVLRLGDRRIRETFAAGRALLHVLAGSVIARLTGEDEPHGVSAHESLRTRALSGGEELDLQGRAAATVVILVRLACADPGVTLGT